ncbi:hypothetical protein O9G_006171 [Rozella allomycis CSF55]|uniref:Uncharacterized protein n=1 Tax=Rozella allomycis (strain CSF55) TaxID=988480 RepID=A0A075B0H5_ROZAC|nr:hypothetical protein O9G_006171 [Rozella allomycis CSF55]|eukprot:EPZ35880.1 hypothetical protein O9G_006171 [Rozella allomycis CSF55]
MVQSGSGKEHQFSKMSVEEKQWNLPHLKGQVDSEEEHRFPKRFRWILKGNHRII